MTDNKSPITPPDLLLQRWVLNATNVNAPPRTGPDIRKIAIQASNWGWQQRDASVANELQEARDEELHACFDWVANNCPLGTAKNLRDARRPKPPSLKERGREALQNIHAAVVMETGGRELDVLKEIVESLPD